MSFRLSTLFLLGAATAIGRAQPAPASNGETREQRLTLLPDGSVAESLSRQQTIGFGNVRIDGEKSEVSLSSLTADQIASAAATRVPTPDLDADAVGGLLQLTSRRAFERSEPLWRASAGASFDELSDRLSSDLSLTYGNRWRERLGYVVTATLDKSHEAEEELELERTRQGDLEEVAAAREETRSSEGALTGLFDWKISDRAIFQLRTETTWEREKTTEREAAYSFDAVPPSAAPAPGESERSLEESRSEDSSAAAIAGLSYATVDWQAELRAVHRLSKEETPESREAAFDRPAELAVDGGESETPRLRASQDADATLYRLQEFQLGSRDREETDSHLALDVRHLRSDRMEAKAGLKYRVRRTERRETEQTYLPTGDGLRLNEALDGYRRETVAEGRAPALHTFPSGPALQRLLASQPGRFDLDVDRSRADADAASYDVRHDLAAGYALVSWNLPARLRLLAGARVERTVGEYVGNEVVFDETGRYEGARPLQGGRTETHLFPGVHLSWTARRGLIFYASYTQSIKRPDYTDVVPSRFIDRNDREIEEGNPALRSTLYLNYDAACEWSYSPDGQLSLDLYHRDIRDPRYTQRDFVPDGLFAGYERSRPVNGGDGSLRGADLSWKQGLGGLTPWLQGTDLALKYVWQRSRQTTPGRPGETLPLTERPRESLEARISWERGKLYVGLEADYQSRALDSIGSDVFDDQYSEAFWEFDLSLSYRFDRSWRVSFDVENLTEEADRTYEGPASRLQSFSPQPRRFSFALRWEL